jgi:PKD domain
VRGTTGALAVVVAASALLSAVPTAPAALAPPATILQPSAAVVALDGAALAQDGSGAVVFRAQAGGVTHLFAALEHAGAWAAPAQLDAASPAAPVSVSAVAVADGGRAAVVWVSGGMLYGAVHAAGAVGFSPAQPIAAATGVPALAMGVSGTAYVAFAAPVAGGSSLQTARLDRTATSFAVLAAPIAAGPVTLAPGGGGPAIVAAADGTAVVAWAATAPDGVTHVFVRRVSGIGPSPVTADANVPSLGGVAGANADSPALGVSYDASIAWVAFREAFGATTQLIVSELLGDELLPPLAADPPGSGSALTPSIAVNGNDGGLLAVGVAPGNDVTVSVLGGSAVWTPATVVNPTADAVSPSPRAASSVAGDGVVVYAPAAGALVAQPFAGGTASGAPLPISSVSAGAVVASDGVFVSADDAGDLLIAYVAGAPGALSVLAQAIVPAPGAPRATGTQLWIADKRPVLHWQRSSGSWAPPSYAVYLDGAKVATTTATSFSVPADLRDGRHSWKVVASDALGQQATSQTRRLLINGAHPLVHVVVSGAHRAGSPVSVAVTASTLSGVRRVVVDYGDGHSAPTAGSTHVYARKGHYVVTIAVTDRAGVSTVIHAHWSVR